MYRRKSFKCKTCTTAENCKNVEFKKNGHFALKNLKYNFSKRNKNTEYFIIRVNILFYLCLTKDMRSHDYLAISDQLKIYWPILLIGQIPLIFKNIFTNYSKFILCNNSSFFVTLTAIMQKLLEFTLHAFRPF